MLGGRSAQYWAELVMVVQRELLPLPPFCMADPPRQDLSRCVRRRILRQQHRHSWMNDGISSLNDIAGAGTFSSSGLVASAAQLSCLQRLERIYTSVGQPPDDLEPAGALTALCGSSAGYLFENLPAAAIQRDLLSLPSADLVHANGCDIMAGGDDTFWKDWRNHMLRDESDADQVRAEIGLSRPHCDPLARDGKRYAEFLDDLHTRGLVEFGAHKAPTIGFFAVSKKDGRQRLIMDTRLANAAFKDPPHTELPTTASFSRIEVEPGTALFIAEADVDNAFHRVLLPSGLAEYFVLPGIRAKHLPSHIRASLAVGGTRSRVAQATGATARLVMVSLPVPAVGDALC